MMIQYCFKPKQRYINFDLDLYSHKKAALTGAASAGTSKLAAKQYLASL